jgi:hypothetical protein
LDGAQATKRLDIALYKNDYRGALTAIANGANPNRVCRGGVTALVQAAEHGNSEAIVMLAKAGAALDAKVPCCSRRCHAAWRDGESRA